MCGNVYLQIEDVIICDPSVEARVIATKRNQGIELNGDVSPVYIPLTNILDKDLVDTGMFIFLREKS